MANGALAETAPLHVARVAAPPDPLLLAEMLVEATGAERYAVLWDATRLGPSYLCFEPLESKHAFDPEPDLPLQPRPRLHGDTPRWVGVLPYECFRGLERGRQQRDPRPVHRWSAPEWWRYGVCVRVDQEGVTVAATDGDRLRDYRRTLERLRPPRPCAPAGARLEHAEPIERHAERIRQALELIRAGEIYEVNLARRMTLETRDSAIRLLSSLGQRSAPEHGGAIVTGAGDLISTSPELLLSLEPGGRVLTSPIKGTRPVAPNPHETAARASELDSDPKERAELAMTIDVERNDLGRICELGTIRISDGPRVRQMGWVLHRLASVEGRLRPGLARGQVIDAMLPSGSVTGAPKVRAMQVIAELESARRGAYTGAFGALTHDGGLRLSMAIRTLFRTGSHAEYYVGGGIVIGSRPEQECEETEWKSRQVLELIQARA